MTARAALIAVFVAGALLFTVLWVRALRTLPPPRDLRPTWFEVAVGVVTDFFDTLGIGSFAVTTSLYRVRRTVPDRVLPGTLNVGHCLPTFAQAILAVTFIEVDPLTLVSMIGAAVVGAWFGAGVVARLPLRAVRIGLSFALTVAAGLMVAQARHWLSSGGEALGLRGASLVVAIVGNAILGALMTLGVGLYAPCMILVSVLGMNVKGAFPIMMGSCALLMPVGSVRFFRRGDGDDVGGGQAVQCGFGVGRAGRQESDGLVAMRLGLRPVHVDSVTPTVQATAAGH